MKRTQQQMVFAHLAKAIAEIDAIGFNKDRSVLSEQTIHEIDIARAKMINVIFANGYEISYSYRLVKSKTNRQLIPIGL